MAILSGVLGPRPLRRTVQVGLEVRVPAVARRHAHLCGLATEFHEECGLAVKQSVALFLFHNGQRTTDIHGVWGLVPSFL